MPVFGAKYRYLNTIYIPHSLTLVKGRKTLTGTCVWSGRQRTFILPVDTFMATAVRVLSAS